MNLRKNLEQFETTLVREANAYVSDLPATTVDLFVTYYEILLRWNQRLHLVAPSPPEVFATRHILESLVILANLPHSATVADVGSGAGLPIIPCLIAREDIRATLIESSPKKTVFLREALKQINRSHNATIIARPFEEIPAPNVPFVTCRALDEFVDKVEALYRWSPSHSTLLLFGGASLKSQLVNIQASFKELRIPNSDQRFLFVVRKS